MTTNRRTLLKQIGLGIAALGIGPLRSLASPAPVFLPSLQSSDGPIRLSFNENPYGMSPGARRAMMQAAAESNRYNWKTVGELITAIAKKNQVADDNVMIGAGSTEILDLLVQMNARHGGHFIVADPSYTSWGKMAEYIGLKKIALPLTTDKRCDLPTMLAAVTADTKMIYICNPNNPTGTICDEQALRSFVKEATKTTMVVVDEAYIDFTETQSLASLVTANKNLVVVKTFSKIYGLAGARVGYALGHKETIERLSKLQTWANGGISVASRAGALAALQDTDFVGQCYAKNEAARKYTIDQLELLNISCIPSHTNFIYFSLAKYNKNFFDLLKRANIQGTNIYEEDGKWTRITVGTMQEMETFIAVIN